MFNYLIWYISRNGSIILFISSDYYDQGICFYYFTLSFTFVEKCEYSNLFTNCFTEIWSRNLKFNQSFTLRV
jgi:hypothetical protein